MNSFLIWTRQWCTFYAYVAFSQATNGHTDIKHENGGSFWTRFTDNELNFHCFCVLYLSVCRFVTGNIYVKYLICSLFCLVQIKKRPCVFWLVNVKLTHLITWHTGSAKVYNWSSTYILPTILKSPSIQAVQGTCNLLSEMRANAVPLWCTVCFEQLLL